MRKTILIGCSVLLATVFIMFVLEKTHVINIYHKSVVQTSTAKPVNTIDYSPATTSDNSNNDQIKQNSTEVTPQTKQLSITMTRATQDPNTKTLIIRALIEGAPNGNCTAELIKNGNIGLTKQATVVQQNSFYTCSGFDIPQSDLPGNGEWSVKITVSDGTVSKNASQNVMLEK